MTNGKSWDVRSSHTYTAARVYSTTITIEDLGDGVGGASTVVTAKIAVVPPLQVATINHNSVTGYLSQAQETSPGAFVPLDNNDWDYNGTTDMLQTGAVAGGPIPVAGETAGPRRRRSERRLHAYRVIGH